MSTRVEEAYGERDQTVDAKGNVTEIEIPYIVFEASEGDAALSAARSSAVVGRSIKGMMLDYVEVVERINDDTWKIKAVYAEEEDFIYKGTFDMGTIIWGYVPSLTRIISPEFEQSIAF